ncbi:HIRAN domain-containing protein [Tepidimonas charontis]|nr:HIRAN domain-containing protein [Tepidimonas charontis]
MPDIDFTLPALVGEWHDGGSAARELLTAQALQEEGEAMHHCVGSYWERCVAGEPIFALTDAQGQRATAQYQPVVLASARDEITYRLVQLRGPCNQEVGKKLSRFASQLAKVINAPERQDARRAALAAIDTLRRLQRDARHAPALPALDATSRARLLPVLARLSFEPAAPGTLLVAHVAGVDYHDFPRLEVQGLARFAAGDTLHVIREPDNPRDALAVRIDWQGHRLGYVPRPDNAEIARRLAAGEGLVCRITRFTPTAPNWRKIEVVITEDRA